MIKSKKQMFIVIAIFVFIIILGGTTYAWFNYRREGAEQRLIAGNIYLTFNENNDGINLTNIFPETVSEARSRNDNYLTFDITGINESNKTLYYEIDINHGDDRESPYVRFADEDLRFDLVELDSNGDEVKYLLNAVSYDELINKRIWVDEISAGSSTEVSRKYKLRMWLSDEVLISDSDPNRDYYATEYKNHYANIRLTVIGDFNEKMFGFQKVQKAILAKQNAETNSCNPVWIDDNGTTNDESDDITYFSGTNDCVDMNYVWYSGKLWRITAIYPDGAMKLVTQNSITTIVFNENNANFYTDSNNSTYMYQWLNEDYYDTLYNANQIIDTTKEWNITMPANTTISTKPAETNMVTAYVGLLNNYDYYNSYRCVESVACSGTSYSTGYLNIDYFWWLLNPYDSYFNWSVIANGNTSNNYVSSAAGVRPSIVIKSGLEFTGNGTISSPYRIVGDKELGTSNELINSRISGEYVKLKNGNNEQIFRIIGVEENKTKIIAMDYAYNKSTSRFSAINSDTMWGTGWAAATNTWYKKLNTTSTGYFDTLVSTYGDMFDSGLYYLGTSGYNYKLSVCANTTSGNTKVCDKTNDKGTFNIGLPRYGEMFATQQAGGNSNSIGMWLMNRMSAYSGARVWYVGEYGNGGYTYSDEYYGARPTLHLKSTVKILSGSGTETDPYVVGL